jgi:hypothetical protein
VVAALAILWVSDIMRVKRITANMANKPEFGRFVIIRVIHHLQRP